MYCVWPILLLKKMQIPFNLRRIGWSTALNVSIAIASKQRHLQYQIRQLAMNTHRLTYNFPQFPTCTHKYSAEDSNAKDIHLLTADVLITGCNDPRHCLFDASGLSPELLWTNNYTFNYLKNSYTLLS